MSSSSLARLGWTEFFEQQRDKTPHPASAVSRVVAGYRGACGVDGEFTGLAEPSGRLRHEAASSDLPAVGDWVEVTPGESGSRGVILRVLERRTSISRAASGTGVAEQVIAANVDLVFVVTSPNQDLSANRLDRYVSMVWEAGATPVVLVNKIDLCDDPGAVVADLRARVPFVDVLAVSAHTSEGVEPLAAHLRPGVTIALVGSSGVGKSSLVNRLLGRSALAVLAVREADGKGRHATTVRQLVALPGGALLIDTPGMRELQPWSMDQGLSAAFRDIERLAAACRFADCTHATEPGCAVREAIEAGQLASGRLEHFRRLSASAEFEAHKHDRSAIAAQKKKWKQIGEAMKALQRERDRD